VRGGKQRDSIFIFWQRPRDAMQLLVETHGMRAAGYRADRCASWQCCWTASTLQPTVQHFLLPASQEFQPCRRRCIHTYNCSAGPPRIGWNQGSQPSCSEDGSTAPYNNQRYDMNHLRSNLREQQVCTVRMVHAAWAFTIVCSVDDESVAEFREWKGIRTLPLAGPHRLCFKDLGSC
jgi:hypothetical protein